MGDIGKRFSHLNKVWVVRGRMGSQIAFFNQDAAERWRLERDHPDWYSVHTYLEDTFLRRETKDDRSSEAETNG